MPYIKQVRRKDLELLVRAMKAELIETPGDLNYLITELAKAYFEGSAKNYQAINDIVGALEGAKLEFYRRVAAPYEDEKANENGDVY